MKSSRVRACPVGCRGVDRQEANELLGSYVGRRSYKHVGTGIKISVRAGWDQMFNRTALRP
jgi:hypothetical protein